ncbi:MAG: FHA domain-containing protein [Planctomycetes bacterium]|nr:FHA domain-containing protein [Planctomycetota bacterium]
MPRLELIVQQPGKAPATVPLDRNLVVGRSRRVDLTIDDEEVGREQFRVGLDDDGPFLEAIGKTNQTIVDEAVLAPGMRRPLFDGTQIRVGRTTFLVRNAEPTTTAPPPGTATPEMTMVSPGPIAKPPQPAPPKPAPPKPVPPAAEQTGGGASPMRTMPGPRPGAPADDFVPDQTMPLQRGPAYRPGAAPQPPAPPPARPGTTAASPR